jgi:hypothetical protein
MLAKRLAGSGLALSAAALAPGAVSATLAMSTVRAAMLVAAGQLAAGATPAAVLMHGVMKAMLLKKLRLVVGAVMLLLAFGGVGVGYGLGDRSGVALGAPPDKPVSELEALRKENELLKLNLQIVLEKVRGQETELQAMRKPATNWKPMQGALIADLDNDGWVDLYITKDAKGNKLFLNEVDGTLIRRNESGGAIKAAEDALKALREAKDKEGRRRATDALEKAIKKLREQVK